MKPTVVPFICEECGSPFEPLEGAICSRCHRLLCRSHFRTARQRTTGNDKDHRQPLCDSCLTQETESAGNRQTSGTFDLDRFVTAQEHDYSRALAEVRAGRKQSHWMWYVFPQLRGLGSSPLSTTYGITSLAEARAYLAHPILGPRLREISEALLRTEGASAHDILGSPDDLKLRSCATLFAFASQPGSVFDQVLVKFFEGVPDAATLSLLKAAAARTQ